MEEGSREKILKLIRTKKSAKTSDLIKVLGISRQKISKHFNRLVDEGILEKTGSTKTAVYHYKKSHEKVSGEKKSLSLFRKLKNLKEDEVYAQLELGLGLKKMPSNVQSIIFYSFTKMLNNAIDHSGAKEVAIVAELDKDEFRFDIKDKGIGIFANVQKKFHLQDEFMALEHVLKGKQTTFPEQHSGQGIFFTSRIADTFDIKSHRIGFTRDNVHDDLNSKDIKFNKGTEVSFRIKRRSRKVLQDLFKQYANEDYEFDRTYVTVHMTADRSLLARSQARRILAGLDQYKMITLDFKKVKEVGQAFVDEVFRVFKRRHPEIQLIHVNASPAVEFMIRRGLNLEK